MLGLNLPISLIPFLKISIYRKTILLIKQRSHSLIIIYLEVNFIHFIKIKCRLTSIAEQFVCKARMIHQCDLLVHFPCHAYISNCVQLVSNTDRAQCRKASVLVSFTPIRVFIIFFFYPGT